MNNDQIKKLASIDSAALSLLKTAATQLGLSGRAYMRTIKVARTIADLASETSILEEHISEALQFRQRPPQ